MFRCLLAVSALVPALGSAAVVPDLVGSLDPLVVPVDTAAPKTATVVYSSDSLNTLATNAIYVVPVLLFIILLDFAIFGAFSERSDNLNPISNFFYHARRGFKILRSRAPPHRNYYGRSEPRTSKLNIYLFNH